MLKCFVYLNLWNTVKHLNLVAANVAILCEDLLVNLYCGEVLISPQNMYDFWHSHGMHAVLCMQVLYGDLQVK